MDKRAVLMATTFGKRIAEDEGNELNSYFVETDQWRRIFGGDVDIVYGAKGAGKSALYSLLLSRSDELRNRGILVVAAENPRGTPIFRDLVSEPPTGEYDFRGIWKLYFLSLAANQLRENGLTGDSTRRILEPLEQAGLLPRTTSLRSMLRSALDYVRNITRVEALESGIKVDPTTGQYEAILGRITLREPNLTGRNLGLISADQLLEQTDAALTKAGLKMWLVLDRLDVAFADSDELEGNALRALFRVYLDLLQYDSITLKIFLRSDIWQRIIGSGFREASHVTRHVTLSWSPQALLNLVVRRALHNEALRDYYQVDAVRTLADMQKQSELFYRIFPEQVDAGPNKPKTFDWMMSRTRDASGRAAPRELIHLLSSIQATELKRLDVGEEEPPGETLFDRSAIKDALPEVSQIRFEQTLCAEYPALREWMRKLEGEKTEQTPESLAAIWAVKREQALEIADKLEDVGFFERRGAKEQPSFWVPFLYRAALRMVQGSATE
jgi:hypothetical protein